MSTRSFFPVPVLMLLSGIALAQPFEAPWVGYNVGVSAFPDNPAPYERDPEAIEAADLDGDGDQDLVVANYDYAAPGGTDGSSGFVVLFNEGGVFAEPVHYTFTFKGSFDIVVGDFDEDGDPDLVLPNSGRITGEDGNTVVLFLNDGAGHFTQGGEFLVAERPMCLAVGDFDSDGHLDVVADSYRFDSRHFAVLFGTGAGSFEPRLLVPVDNVPNFVAAADLDGDGDDDILVSVLGDLYLVRSDAAGGFATPVLISETGSQPIVGRMAAGDLDGDGDLDIVHGVYQAFPGQHAGEDIAVRRGLGNGAFSAPTYYDTIDGTTPEAVELVDFDGDGDLDVVTCDWSGVSGDGIAILFNNGSGLLGGVHHVPAGQGTQDIAVSDLDGDGDPDVATADQKSLAVTIHANPGDGLLPVLATRYAAPVNNTHLDAGDVDGDGDLDVFTSGGEFGTPGGLLRNQGDGTFAAPVIYTHSPTYGRGISRAKLRDLDGDGDLDLLYNDAHTDFQEDYNFYTALNDGAGQFGPIVTWFIFTCGTGGVDAFDLDNDGDLDVVNLEELNCAGQDAGNRVFVSLNDGDAGFTHLPPFQISAGPHALAGGDLDEDGIVDLVTTHYTPYGARNVINVLRGLGDGTFAPEVVYAVGQGPMDVVVVDLDGDGHLDIATANSGSDNIATNQETMSVLWGAGDGSFTPATTSYAPFAPDLLGATGMAAGDVDADGDLDLMVTTVAGGVAMYVNDGAHGFDFPHRLGIYWRPCSPLLADFDGDGAADLATLVDAGELAILPGSGGTTTDVEPDEPGAPTGAVATFAFSAANPNPFTDTAHILLSLAVAQPVRVEVYDVRGRRVETLHDGPLAAGTHGFTLRSEGRPSGLYFVRAEGRTLRATRRVMLVR